MLTIALGQSGRLDFAVRGKRDVALRHPLEPFGQRVIQLETKSQRSEKLGAFEADGNRHRHHLEHAVGLGPESGGLVARKRALNFRSRPNLCRCAVHVP